MSELADWAEKALKMRKVHPTKMELFAGLDEDKIHAAIRRADKYEMPGACLEEWVTIQGKSKDEEAFWARADHRPVPKPHLKFSQSQANNQLIRQPDTIGFGTPGG